MEEKKNTVHVLLTYNDGDDETYCNVFTSKQAVKDYVKDMIKENWMNDEEDTDSDELKNLQEEACEALDERGYWRDSAWETTYVYDEKEYTA